MSETLEFSVSILLAIAGFAAAAVGAYRWCFRRGPRRYCPGRRASRWRLLWPVGWFVIRPCGYDLSHHCPDAAGCVTCPECGSRIGRERMLARVCRLRLTATAVACLLAATGTMLTGLARSGSLMPMIPATALIAGEAALGERTPRAMRRELRGRMSGNALYAWQTRAAIRLLVRDLRDDTLKWNALSAKDRLRGLGALATPALIEALDSTDYQQRQWAAYILRSRAELTPSGRLLQVTVEGLRDDDLKDLRNARHGVAYLLKHALAAREYLLTGMRGSDVQQRFLCAYVAAGAGLASLADDAAPILIDHLRHNSIRGDRMCAVVALAHLGDAALPWLHAAAAEGNDAQQREAAAYLIALAAHNGDGPPPRMPRTATRAFNHPLAQDPSVRTLPRFGP